MTTRGSEWARGNSEAGLNPEEIAYLHQKCLAYNLANAVFGRLNAQNGKDLAATAEVHGEFKVWHAAIAYPAGETRTKVSYFRLSRFGNSPTVLIDSEMLGEDFGSFIVSPNSQRRYRSLQKLDEEGNMDLQFLIESLERKLISELAREDDVIFDTSFGPSASLEDKKRWLSYLQKIAERFGGQIQNMKFPLGDVSEEGLIVRAAASTESILPQKKGLLGSFSRRGIEKGGLSLKHHARLVKESGNIVWEI